MNRILVVVVVILSLLSCLGKEKEKTNEKKEVVQEKPNSEEDSEMNKEAAEKKIVVTISGHTLTDINTTLKAVDNMIKAMERRDEIADLEDSLYQQDLPILSRVDVESLNELISQALQQAGVKKPTVEVFNAALKRIFLLDVQHYNERKRAWRQFDNIILTPAYLYNNLIPKEVTDNPYEVNYSEQYNYYFDTQNRFSIETAILPNFFMYVKDENTYLTTVDQIYNKKKNEFYIGIYKSTVAFNKYIFYHDYSSYSWFLHHDPQLLSNLVLMFSYQQENLLNGWLLNEKRKQVRLKEEEGNQHAIEKVTGVFAFKNYREELEIREKLMQYIEEVTTAEDNDLLLLLDDYATEIVSFDNSSSKQLRKGFTQEELYKIFAYAAYYSYKGFVKYYKGLGRFSSTRENWPNFCALTTVGQNADVQEALKKNMYYDIPGLKEAVEHIEQLAALSDED